MKGKEGIEDQKERGKEGIKGEEGEKMVAQKGHNKLAFAFSPNYIF